MLCRPSRAERTSAGDPQCIGTRFSDTATNSLLIMLKAEDLLYAIFMASDTGSQLLLLGWDSKQQSR